MHNLLMGCNDIASGIAGVRFGIERGMLGQGTQVDKHPRHAGEHLAAFDDRVEVVDVGECLREVNADVERQVSTASAAYQAPRSAGLNPMISRGLA